MDFFRNKAEKWPRKDNLKFGKIKDENFCPGYVHHKQFFVLL